MKKLIFLLSSLIMGIFAFGQIAQTALDYSYKGSINLGTGLGTYSATAASTWLQIGPVGTNKAMILPRVNDPSNIVTPADGMIIFDLGSNTTKIRVMGVWLELTTGAPSTFVPSTRSLTVNGTAFDLSANRTWTITTTGTTNRITVSGGAGSTPTIDISAAYVGQTSITTLGTIGTGTWQGTPVADAYIATSGNWNTAYTDRLKWDGGATGLTASTGRTSLGGTTVGQNFFTLTNPSAITFPRINADNSVSALDAATFRTAIGAGTGSGSVTSVAMTVPTGLTVSGSPVTTSGTLAVALQSGYSIPTTASQTNWDAAYNDKVNSITFSASTLTLTQQDAGTVTQSVPTFNQNTTGSAATLTTPRTIQGVSFDGSANINILNGTGFVKVSGTTVSYDNSTYLTTSSAASTYVPFSGGLLTGQIFEPNNFYFGTKTNGGTNVSLIGMSTTDIVHIGVGGYQVQLDGLTSGSAGNFVVNGGSGLLVTRTAAQVLSDIGAASTASLSGYLPLTASSTQKLTGDLYINKTNSTIVFQGNTTDAAIYNNGSTFRITDNSTGTKGIIISLTDGAVTQLGSGALTWNGSGVFGSTVFVKNSVPTSIAAISGTYFGYSSSYNVLQVGTTGAASIAFNVDPSANLSGAFTGDGSEYLWRNVGSFRTPNAANTGYNTLFTWNSSGQMTTGGNFNTIGNMMIGVDGTYGANYSVLAFTGTATNGNNRIFAGNANGDDIYIAAGTGRSVQIWANGSSSSVAQFGGSQIGFLRQVEASHANGVNALQFNLSIDGTNTNYRHQIYMDGSNNLKMYSRGFGDVMLINYNTGKADFFATLNANAGLFQVAGWDALKYTTGSDLKIGGYTSSQWTTLNFYTSTALAMVLNSSQQLRLPAYGAGTLVSDASGNITSSAGGGGTQGTYTPSVTNSVNVSSASALVAMYTRIGNVVSVSGSMDINAAGAGPTIALISVPINSNFANGQRDAGGAGVSRTSSVDLSGGIYGATTNTVAIHYQAVASGTHTFAFTFSYIIN